MLIIVVELVFLCKASQLPSKCPLEAKVQVTLQQFDCEKTTKAGPFPFIQDIVHDPLPSQNTLQVELKCKGNDRHLNRGKHVILTTCLVEPRCIPLITISVVPSLALRKNLCHSFSTMGSDSSAASASVSLGTLDFMCHTKSFCSTVKTARNSKVPLMSSS